MTLQDRGELLDEGIEAQLQAADLIGQAVVGDHGGDGREQAHGRGDQRFGNAGRDRRKRRLLHIAEIVEGTHDAPDRAEQSHVRTGRADRGQDRQVLLQAIQLAQLRHPHRAPRAVQQLLRRHALLAQPAELAESRLEDALQAGTRTSLGFNIAIQGGEIAAGPKRGFKFRGLAARAPDHLALAKDNGPGGDRSDQQQRHHHLHDGARIQHHAPNRQVIGHCATP